MPSRVILFCLICVLSLAPVAPVSAATPTPQAMAAGPSLLLDAASGAVIASDRPGEPWYPASLTKLMTAYLVFGALKEGRLTLDQKLPVSELAASQPPSKLGMQVGSAISAGLALQSLLVYSANDMAYVLAEGTAGSAEAFVRQMNDTAQRLGLSGTHYANPNGLYDPAQYTTARDLGILARRLLWDYPEYQHYFSQANVAIGKRKLLNRNMLLRQMPSADGMKTGFICNSGFNLVASASDDGHRLIAVVLGAASAKSRADRAQEMLTAGFGQPSTTQSVEAIANLPQGQIQPSDLTTEVCGGKTEIALARPATLKGHGVSLGRYATRADADRVLVALMPAAKAAAEDANPAIVRMAQKGGGYVALFDHLEEEDGARLCAALITARADLSCSALTPAELSAMAGAAKPPSRAQGDSTPASGKRKKVTSP